LTVDDTAGAAFARVARILGLTYPGGPSIDQAASQDNPKAIAFPNSPADPRVALFDFSFAGLLTTVAQQAARPDRVPVEDVCASFQDAVADVLTAKTAQAAIGLEIGTIAIVGGVAANSRIRSLAAERCDEAGIGLRIPHPSLCTDNGAMIAALGSYLATTGIRPRFDLTSFKPNPDLPIDTVFI
jgi:tRNA N6-adenosine threonylcarbamoyltransferase